MSDTISKIKRKQDEKVFECYFRSGRVVENTKLDLPSYWIAEDGDEITMDYIDTDDFEILKRVYHIPIKSLH